MHKGQQWQIPMFMNSREVLEQAYLGDDDNTWAGKTPDTKRVLEQKLEEAGQDAFYPDYEKYEPNVGGVSSDRLDQNIRRNGIQKPLGIDITPSGQRVLADGHHRLAVMNAHNPEAYFPVEHYDYNYDVPEQNNDLDDNGGIGSEWADA